MLQPIGGAAYVLIQIKKLAIYSAELFTLAFLLITKEQRVKV